MDQWKICLRDKYPAYIGWDTFERIQAMIRDNHSEYDRNKTRGVPRPGKALLHGIVYCGECGHKMVVQYKSGTHYICNYLRQQYRVPVCQNLPADPIDAHVVGAFLEALSPVELDLYGKAVAALRQGRRSRSGRRSGSRSSGSATRPAWPSGSTTRPTRTTAWWPPSWSGVGKRRCGNSRTPRSGSGTSRSNPEPLKRLSAEEREAFLRAGETIPELWRQDRLSPQQKKAFLRSLIDKVVVHRAAPDTLQVRIVWRGGDTTVTALPVTVGSLARLSSAEAMEKEILELDSPGQDRRGDRGRADAARVSLSQAHRRPAQHRPHPSPASSPVPQAQPIPSTAHPRLPDRVPDRAELGDLAALDL